MLAHSRTSTPRQLRIPSALLWLPRQKVGSAETAHPVSAIRTIPTGHMRRASSTSASNTRKYFLGGPTWPIYINPHK